MTTEGAALFAHLETLTDDRALFEHADKLQRRVDHGYCTDDNARMLIVTSRENDSGSAARLSRLALAFTLAAQVPDGRSRNRMNVRGEWTDRPTTDDCWGRSVWGLGVAATQHGDPSVRAAALAGFDRAAVQRSRWSRAMAFAALGAGEVLAVNPAHARARALIDASVAVIGIPGPEPWVWPEPRLRYANAALAEAMIVAGAAKEDAVVLERGMAMLAWLLGRETKRGRLSVVGVGGSAQTDADPQFDQQPIEVAAIADCCWRAYMLTGDPKWARGVVHAAEWFDGANDTGVTMRDITSGGGFDGLRADGVNLNQGAESTLALISTMQRAQTLTESVS
jgi:hypothetical protein